MIIVRRYSRGRLIREYGPFTSRDVAERVAQRAAERHRGDVVIVNPVRDVLPSRHAMGAPTG